MAKGWYIGNENNIAKKVKRMYIGDANNIARKVKKIYIGDTNGKARLCWSGVNGNIVFTTKGTSSNYANKVYYAKNLGAPREITLPNVQNGVREIKVACSKTRFVCTVGTISSSGYASIYYSDDCINWNPVIGQMYTSADYYVNIRYFEETGYFVVNNLGSYFWSTDGVNWGSKQINSDVRLTDVAYGNGTYLITIHNHYPTTCKTLGGDTTQIYDPTGKTNFSCAAYGNGFFVAHKPSAGIHRLNLDTMKWTLVTDLTKGITSHEEISMTYGNGMFLCGSTFSGIFYSYDGINWSSYIPPLRIMKVSFDGEKFLGTNDTNYAYSYDGLNWTYVPQPNTLAYYSIAGN